MAVQRQRMDGEDATEELLAMHDEPGPTIFAIEDEPLVRQLVATALRRKGWSVFEAEDGSIALSVAPASLGLLVADYDVRSNAEYAMAEHLRRRDRDLLAPMASGRPAVARQRRNPRRSTSAFARKPLAAEGLGLKVGSIPD